MKFSEIVIAKDFSEYPGPRYKSLGCFSAEEFMDELLLPALDKSNVVTVIFDGVLGFGSSFLEEAFGGLVRKGYSIDELASRLNFISEDDKYLIPEIWGYIKDAAKE
ncbi:DUF4325 domain-containing protein [Vibrio parahaemolyticus]|nr:DUF4325 domain-containing protein [Vibrio parahaemolyticus]EHH1260517.1 STAS-like domain-containing protein [Vibrio parahaemolyticus]